jgi:cobalt/nickel transport system permease protein
VLTPLGLVAPGGAFGEEAPRDLDLGTLGLSAVPAGLNRYNGFWSHTVLGGYGSADGQNPTLGYWLSAVVGIAVIGIAIYLVGKLAAAAAGFRSLPRRDAADAADSARSADRAVVDVREGRRHEVTRR